MKIARSNLLGELLDAAQVEHADTHGFQIVCPCCDESVFKVRRPLEGGRLSEFFSHRQANAQTIAECEMRVGGITKEDRASRDAEARGQTMEMFNAHLRQALSLEAWVYGTSTPKDLQKKMFGRPLMPLMHLAIREDQVRLGVDDIFEDEYNTAMDHMDEHGIKQQTTFGTSVQKRVAKDLFRNLLTNQGKSNHGWLFRHASLRVYMLDKFVRSAVELGLRPPGHNLPVHIHLQLKAIHTKNPRIARQFLDQGIKEAQARGDTDGFYRVMTMAMILDVMRIPFAEMLTNHRAGLPILDGLKPRSIPDARSGMHTPEEARERLAQLRAEGGPLTVWVPGQGYVADEPAMPSLGR